MEEKREAITLIVGQGEKSLMFYESEGFKYVRVFPACRYSDVGSLALTPEDLNTAVQMWMNKEQKQDSIPDREHLQDEIRQRNEIIQKHCARIKELEEEKTTIVREGQFLQFSRQVLIRRIKELEGANAARQQTIELLCKTIENMARKEA